MIVLCVDKEKSALRSLPKKTALVSLIVQTVSVELLAFNLLPGYDSLLLVKE